MKLTIGKLFPLTVLLLISFWFLSACHKERTFKNSENASVFSENSETSKDRAFITALLVKGQENKNMIYDLVIKGEQPLESKVWFKDKKIRADSILNDRRTTSIFDLEKGEVYSYLPGDKLVTKNTITEYQYKDYLTPLDYAKNIVDYEIENTETIDGLDCQVLSIPKSEGMQREWICLDTGMVVKIEDQTKEKTTTIEFKNIQINSTIPDCIFELPKEIEIIDLRNLPCDPSPKKH
ncbi:MAG: LolA family protein [Desulfitobacteriia bacterium]|jgi:outer membrane lipoprotein-sorting protein